jgi:lipopolysaccharide export system permease protein
MMLFQRRIFSELLRNTLTTMVLLTAVMVLIISATIVHKSEGLSLLAFARSVPVFAATQMHLTLPLSVLVAVVLTYGRAAADNEVDTLRASGVHPLHVMTPGLVFGALTSLVLLLALDYVMPWAEVGKRRLVKDTDIRTLLHNKLSTGEPVELDDRTIISVDGFDEQGLPRGMRILLFDEDGVLEHEIVAESAELAVIDETSEIQVTLRNFHSVKGPRLAGEEVQYRRPQPKEIANLDETELTTPQLLAWAHRGHSPVGYSLAQAALTVDLRLASAAACLLFVILGLPVALMFRKHDRTAAFLVAFLLALFLYYPSREVSIALTRREAISPMVASWSGNVFLLAIGLVLCWRVFRR